MTGRMSHFNHMSKTIISIDPGASGGFLVKTKSSCVALKMPDTLADWAEQIRCWNNYANQEGEELVAYVEDIPKFCGPKLPGSSVFVMAENFGAIQGILAALNIRTIMVRPQEWQKGLGVGTRNACKSKTQWKQKLKAEAQRRFPTLKLTNATADAALILDYALTKEK